MDRTGRAAVSLAPLIALQSSPQAANRSANVPNVRSDCEQIQPRTIGSIAIPDWLGGIIKTPFVAVGKSQVLELLKCDLHWISPANTRQVA